MSESKRRRRERGLFGQPISEAGDQEIVRTVKLALRLGRRHLADHAHKYAPKKYTQAQLFACLILKAHLGCTYRKVEELLVLMPAVREALRPADYGQRWMCESVNSAIKRISGSTLRSRKRNTLFAEAALKVVAYAVKV